MSKPSYSQKGELNRESIERMEPEELRQWIFNRLHGDDPTFGGAPGDQPHYLLVVVYPHLKRTIREDIENILIDFIHEIACDSPTQWIGKAGGELFLMADPILINSPRKNYTIDLLLRIVAAEKFDGAECEELRFRALQALIALDYHPSPNFWRDLYDKHGESYAPLVLEGLARTELSAAFEWLGGVTWAESLERSLLFLMPNLLERYGAGEVKKNLVKHWRNYPESTQSALEELAQFEGFSIEDIAHSHTEETWVDAFLTMANLLNSYLAAYREIKSKSGPESYTEAAVRTIRTLGLIIPNVRSASVGISGDLEGMWESYVESLTSALEYPELAPEAYEQMIGQLPLSEVMELTGAILKRKYLEMSQCNKILRHFYSADETERILNQSPEDNLLDILPSIVAAFSGRLKSYDPATLLIEEDEKVPRDLTSWTSGILREAAGADPLPLSF